MGGSPQATEELQRGPGERLEAVPKEAGMAPPSLGQGEAAGLQRIPPQVILETGSGLWTQTWMQTGRPCSAWGKSV